MRRCFVVVAVLAGCSSAPKGPPEDRTLARLGHAGDIAFNLEQPEQAAEQYRAALARARTRDDAAAIADAGFNLATAQLRAGQPRAALDTARQLQAELARRGVAEPAFDLVAATALFRLNDLAAADVLAAGLTRQTDPALADSAWFLRGLIADTGADGPGLATAAASLTAAADAGDSAELRARVSHDRALALRAADLRRDALDYRGMARCLALAARYTPDASSAADLYLRAGRSAAAQGDVQQARIWLSAARDRAPDAVLRTEAEQAQHDLAVR
jgi:tetratricopeptide (TPR) repeat protein